VDRDPRQIKFLLVDDDLYNNAWNSRRLARRQIKFRSVDPLLESDSVEYDADPGGPVRRQIKFGALPVKVDVESAIPGDPQTKYSGGRRDQRQIKFRSVFERAVEPKKHAEDRRQVKFSALSNPPDRPLMTYETDINQLPIYWYRRR